MLPSYADLFEWMHGCGMEPLPCPTLKPTRKGMGRYLMQCAYADIFVDITSEWDRIYRACAWAYDVMLREFHLRLLRDTFSLERVRVESLILERPRGTAGWPLSPQDSDDWVYRDKVLRWARHQ